ncbi:type I restriction endonuclease subunit R [Megasphaera vaginalis (ex Srinivasan et al. 2021)]|uniref:Type I restriction enzyme R protein, N-terminal domain protein n=1 Tax=Megasphaera vaginalis (ex Srinivasan et al. 2021) TaxID=1111454 RepID=U7UM74_9FIRM|nr:type I restriction endonuclease [Megasphaera vaginalis (ex Srinivasan et al. 2021)]ERT59994.1 type I restriction enzyme R protein, N-terminal domain protein [Megasphaera vaginalis (ex Srinivasan et al. 2021)]
MGIRTEKAESALENQIIEYLQTIGYDYVKPSEMKLFFNKKYAIDEKRLFSFIEKTQPTAYDKHRLDTDLGRQKFLNNLSSALIRDGVAHVLKEGVKMYPTGVIFFYHALDKKRPSSFDEFNSNIFSVTNQLTYSEANPGLELDICVFVNGLPIMTMELKSRMSGAGWTYKDAEDQYKNDRDSREPLFMFKRCFAHFAVDENYVSFTTKLNGKDTFFMPFNKGNGDGGAGNPIGEGTMTDYLWKDFLSKKTLRSLITQFVYIQRKKDTKTKKTKETLIFPRFHQYRVVTRLVEDVEKNGVGGRYLIQHSAGSGKSNSITWLAYRLVEAEKDYKKLFDSVIVVTDRKNLDKQISDNIRSFISVSSNFAHSDSSKELEKLLVDGKKIITTTVQKFPYIIETVGSKMKGKNFAIIIDEAHSSQSGKAAASLSTAISGNYKVTDDMDSEDYINAIIEARKMPENASYFAFTATPKAKTIEMFGSVFDLYSMKQAIEEGFILDVLKNYTTYGNYYKVYKTVKDNPLFESKKASRKIRNFVEGQEFPIRQKSEEIVNHFINNSSKKINGKAKAMVVTSSILRAIEYYFAINDILNAHKSPFKALVAFSGEKEYRGKKVTESLLNGFSDKETPEVFKKDEYKFLIVADKYQTGYDEPLLHTMYVDKILNDVKAVQTLSRLNRCCENKIDTCVLDFANDADDIKDAFQPFYKETKLIEGTDPNKLYEILGKLDYLNVYEEDEVDRVIDMFFENKSREFIDPIMDTCVERYKELDEEDQVEFKSGVKSFIRTYNFLSAILPIGQIEWTKKSIFFELLVHRLPTPRDDKGINEILESIDLESYRLEKQNELNIALENEDGETSSNQAGTARPFEPEMESLDIIIANFNDIFGNIDWNDKDNVARQIKELPDMVAKDERIINAIKNSDKGNVKIEYENVLADVMRAIMKDNMELFLQFTSNQQFKKWLSDSIFMEIMNKLKDDN